MAKQQADSDSKPEASSNSIAKLEFEKALNISEEYKSTLYKDFRVYYRTYGDIGKFRRLKIEKYYCVKTHCFPLFIRENIVPIPLADERMRSCESECGVYFKEFQNNFKKSYFQAKSELDECLKSTKNKECKSMIFSKYVKNIDEYGDYLLE